MHFVPDGRRAVACRHLPVNDLGPVAEPYTVVAVVPCTEPGPGPGLEPVPLGLGLQACPYMGRVVLRGRQAYPQVGHLLIAVIENEMALQGHPLYSKSDQKSARTGMMHERSSRLGLINPILRAMWFWCIETCLFMLLESGESARTQATHLNKVLALSLCY